MLMRDFFLLFFNMPQVRTIHAWLFRLSLWLCVYNSQSCCVVVEEIMWYYSMTSSSLQACMKTVELQTSFYSLCAVICISVVKLSYA